MHRPRVAHHSNFAGFHHSDQLPLYLGDLHGRTEAGCIEEVQALRGHNSCSVSVVFLNFQLRSDHSNENVAGDHRISRSIRSWPSMPLSWSSSLPYVSMWYSPCPCQPAQSLVMGPSVAPAACATVGVTRDPVPHRRLITTTSSLQPPPVQRPVRLSSPTKSCLRRCSFQASVLLVWSRIYPLEAVFGQPMLEKNMICSFSWTELFFVVVPL